MSNTIYICTHCDRADSQTRSWPTICKLHVIPTDEDHVILVKRGGKMRVKFYDPDISRVEAERNK